MPTSLPALPPGYVLQAAALIAGRCDRVRANGFADGEDMPFDEGLATAPAATYLTNGSGRARAIALDFDATTDGIHDAWRDAQHAVVMLERHGIRAIVCRSSSQGGFHVFATFPDGFDAVWLRRLAPHLKDQLPTLDTSLLRNGHASAIRPPGALHRDGSRSTPIADPAVALRRLEEGNQVVQLQEFCRELGVRIGTRLSSTTWKLLDKGTGSMKGFRSEPFQSLVAGAKAAGWSEQRLRAELAQRDHDLAERALEPSTRDRDQLAQSWSRAAIDDRPRTPTPATAELLAAYRRLIAAYPTDQRRRDTEQSLLELVVNRCELRGATAAGLSARDAASHAVFSPDTCNQALCRLVEHGILRRRVYASRNRQASGYELVPVQEWPEQWRERLQLAEAPESAEIRAVAGCELFAWGEGDASLGKRRYRIWRFLAQREQGMTSTELASAFGIATIRAFEHAHLLRLEAAGFVRRVGEIWQAVILDRAAVRILASARGLIGRWAERRAKLREWREEALTGAKGLERWLDEHPDQPRRFTNARKDRRAARSQLPDGDDSAPTTWLEQDRQWFEDAGIQLGPHAVNGDRVLATAAVALAKRPALA